MKIAIFFDQNNFGGGGFQQSISDAKRIISLFSQEHEIFFYCNKRIKQKLLNYFDKNSNLTFINYKYNILSKIFRKSLNCVNNRIHIVCNYSCLN